MKQKVKEELKQEFVQKLYGEFSTYREHLLCENPTDLIAEAYKIETFSSLYEVLLAKSAQLSDVALLNLLNMSSGILEGMYKKWLGVKDHSYQELEEYVGHEVIFRKRYKEARNKSLENERKQEARNYETKNDIDREPYKRRMVTA